MGFPVVRVVATRCRWWNVISGVGYTNQIDWDGEITYTVTKVSNAFHTVISKASSTPPGYEPDTPGVAYSICGFPGYEVEAGTLSGATFTRDTGGSSGRYYLQGGLGQPGVDIIITGAAPQDFRADASAGRGIQYGVANVAGDAWATRFIIGSDGQVVPVLPMITPVEPVLALNVLARPVVSLRVTTQTVIDGGGP